MSWSDSGKENDGFAVVGVTQRRCPSLVQRLSHYLFGAVVSFSLALAFLKRDVIKERVVLDHHRPTEGCIVRTDILWERPWGVFACMQHAAKLDSFRIGS